MENSKDRKPNEQLQTSPFPSELLTIPKQITPDWPAAFQSAQIKYIIPSDQAAILPESVQQHPADSLTHSELLTWLDKLVKAPTRKSIYLGESLKVYIVLSITEPAKVEFTEHHYIQNHLKTNVSINVQGNLLRGSSDTKPSIRSDRHAEDPSSGQLKQSNSLNHYQAPIHSPHPFTSSPRESLHLSQSKFSQLFTTSFSHVQVGAADGSNRVDFKSSSKLKPSNIGAQVTMFQVAKLANQWLVVWKVDCEMGTLQNPAQAGSLSLSSVITYHSTQPPIVDHSRPSILPTSPLSASPPRFNPRSSSSRVPDSGSQNVIEIDLFDGMRRDVGVSLTRPFNAPGSSASSVYQSGSNKLGQSNRQGQPSNRSSHSQVNSKISLGFSNPSRSEEYLPSFPEERSQSAPAISIPIARRAVSSANRKESTPIRLTHQEIKPTASNSPYLERHLTSFISIIDPLILRVETIAPENRLKTRDLTTEQSNHPKIDFIEMEKPFNPMLMVELRYPGDPAGTNNDDFLLESLDIQLEQQGLLAEFDNFVTSTIKIMPIHPTESTGAHFPYQISQDEVHSLIYAVQIEPANLRPEQVQQNDSSFLQYGCPPINISLPPSTLISNVSSAFKLQRTGISIHEDGSHSPEEENLLSSRADNMQASGSTPWGTGKSHRSTIKAPSLRNAHGPGPDDVPESKARLPSQNESKQPAGSVYLFSITIQGKMVSKDSSVESTGPISATWTSLLSSHNLSDSTTLELQRQTTKENMGHKTMPWLGVEQSERFRSQNPLNDVILSGAYDDVHHYNPSVFPHGGLVAGSQRHTASNLINALQELSTFQKRSSTGAGLSKQLSPLPTGHHDSGFVTPKVLPDDHPLPDSPTFGSLSIIQSGRRFLPNNNKLKTPTISTSTHSSPQVPEQSHQPSESSPNPGSEYLSRGFKSNQTNPRSSGSTKLTTPGLIESTFSQQDIQTNRSSLTFDRPAAGVGSRRAGEMMVKVKCLGDGTNRFKVLSEFAIEIHVFNCSSSSSSSTPWTTEGPFEVMILTNKYQIHQVVNPQDNDLDELEHDDYNDGGIISLDEAIHIGPLGAGECQAIKIRLIGLKPGIFQLHGIHFLSISPHNNPPLPPLPPQEKQQQQPLISQFVLVDPLVVLIE
ncbi:hypothetical protein MJO28_001838 [Puccinia striiformis f. sp. tritici]|uniref:TRAPP trafficking subunit Trs65-domain-containing protein n=2 Tax=Puccinia striiformis f. sp. tritici TaxID=168172 RepID=A0A0L0VUM9_9BASI|nr:hypothetical protein Pst134EA_002939 [Puccinia striiformis f. sp. tritici]KNF02979.1 hypothetical protein PSTG_03929 [Puccinia striiformis f. sp. tritici PST-78]KAH9464479.1 hypothetical protein Pst134EB_004012 [Puccinia striiformis f. sp. tritici]KAH9472317.1 hypothetical protein Pst134EA_002939 [Puccinia striiformis f. sp. tritici]KAI7961349.1 hypothetical protein MJO28_001838 [Puccinia striiformis f. sp. tritici]KAI7966144.1 hypothetical protein MJO29_001892 [Puccinia striiformis f. sp. 